MPEKTRFCCPKHSCQKKFTSDSWRLKQLKLHHPEHVHVTHQKNLTIRSTPWHVQNTQYCPFNAHTDSVEDLHAYPYPEHIEIIRDSESQPLTPLLPHTDTYIGDSTPLNNRNATLMVRLRRTYKTIPTTHLRRLKSTSISSVGTRTRAWSRTMMMCWRKKTQLCVSQASKTEIGSRSSWLPCWMIRLLGCGTYTLWRIWDRRTITNAPSNTGVETSSKAWDGWGGSQPTQSISHMHLSVALAAIRHRNASILKCTLWTADGTYR